MTHDERVHELLYSTEDRAELCERMVKLEELVRDMWHLLFDWLFKNHEVPWKELEAAHDRLREMEVPDA